MLVLALHPSQAGLMKMLTLVWNSDKSVVEEVLSTFCLNFLGPEDQPFPPERVSNGVNHSCFSRIDVFLLCICWFPCL